MRLAVPYLPCNLLPLLLLCEWWAAIFRVVAVSSALRLTAGLALHRDNHNLRNDRDLIKMAPARALLLSWLGCIHFPLISFFVTSY